jgi:hypothetical protein
MLVYDLFTMGWYFIDEIRRKTFHHKVTKNTKENQENLKMNHEEGGCMVENDF